MVSDLEDCPAFFDLADYNLDDLRQHDGGDFAHHRNKKAVELLLKKSDRPEDVDVGGEKRLSGSMSLSGRGGVAGSLINRDQWAKKRAHCARAL
ncbi:unnamed protein product [Toxocara canis]|uniref:ANK_REP_REGION domain-containing protein n=1 Tax=Toxocara canis TaxID=6265 RepID=A0A183VED9_TOXCA|nr:unnamed protein product [Toxocara canis]